MMQEPEAEAVAEPSGPGFWDRRMAGISGGMAGVANAFARNRNPTLGQIGAAMAGGAQQGKQQEFENEQAEEMMGMRRQQMAGETDALNFRRQEAAMKAEEARKRQELIATLPPEQQKMVSLFGDQAADMLMPQAPKLMEVGGNIVAATPEGVRTLYQAPPEQMSPYQLASLNVDQQPAGARGPTAGARRWAG